MYPTSFEAFLERNNSWSAGWDAAMRSPLVCPYWKGAAVGLGAFVILEHLPGTSTAMASITALLVGALTVRFLTMPTP